MNFTHVATNCIAPLSENYALPTSYSSHPSPIPVEKKKVQTTTGKTRQHQIRKKRNVRGQIAIHVCHARPRLRVPPTSWGSIKSHPVGLSTPRQKAAECAPRRVVLDAVVLLTGQVLILHHGTQKTRPLGKKNGPHNPSPAKKKNEIRLKDRREVNYKIIIDKSNGRGLAHHTRYVRNISERETSVVINKKK